MHQISFTINCEPVPASRPRVTGNGMTFYPKRHMEYQNFLKNVLQDAPALDHDGPVLVRLLFVMPPYKTSNAPVHRSDVDNLSKLPLDCMTKCLVGDKPKFWKDDAYVVVLEASKRFAREGEAPHTKVEVLPVMGNPEDFVEQYFNK